MARTTIVTQSNCKFEQAENIINNILSKNGFKKTTINSGKNVWKKGTGFLTAMQFIKIDFSLPPTLPNPACTHADIVNSFDEKSIFMNCIAVRKPD